MTRRPSLTLAVASDLELLAEIATAGLREPSAAAASPETRRRVKRAIGYLEALARWRRAQEKPAGDGGAT